MRCPFRPMSIETKLVDEDRVLPDDVKLIRHDIEFNDCYQNNCAAWSWSREEGKYVCALCRRGA